MPIKPVDYQVVIPRAVEAAKISNEEAQRHAAASRQQAISARQEAENSLKQVYSQSKVQDVRISEKEKEKHKKDEKEKKGKNKKSTQEGTGTKTLKNELKTSTIDIKI